MAQTSSVFRRLAQACMAAALGSYLGYQYALATLPPAALEKAHLGGMYATAGAVAAVLLLRMSTMLVALGREYLGRRR